MLYGAYKSARNAAWKFIVDYEISSLPIVISDITSRCGITLLKDSKVHELKASQSGKTILQNNKFYVIYNDKESVQRCRFTIAHELGHIALGHLMINTTAYRTFKITDDNESAANVFARDLLAPACVLHELQVLRAENIAKLCNISLEAATYREQRMKELERRNAWYMHPLERQVYENFKNFIESKK